MAVNNWRADQWTPEELTRYAAARNKSPVVTRCSLQDHVEAMHRNLCAPIDMVEVNGVWMTPEDAAACR